MSKFEDIRPAIGIDLGTTNSRVGIWLDKENRFELISNDHGYQSTPSYVAFTETERLIGDAAKDQVSRNPANTVFDVKRLIGRKFNDLGTDADKMHIQWPFKVARGVDDKPMIYVEYKGKEKIFSAEDVYSMILGNMKDLAEVYSGSVVNGASVSYPHCFTSAQRQATRNACSMAGLEIVTLVHEPICAVLAYILKTDRPPLSDKKVMIFDLGGGSLDVTLFSFEDNIVEVKATSGDRQLGGEDFDLRLLHHFIQEIRQKYENDITGHPRVVRRLKKQVERVKLALSSEVETSIQIDSLLEDFNFYSTISRACFEEMNMDLFEKCIKCVEECLQSAEVDKANVDEVVLIGGSSRIPKVQELLAEFFNDKAKLNTSMNPDEAVVCGAAARSGISRGCVFADYIVVDAIPKSLGLETVGGAMHVMHPRNSSIQRKSEQLFTTVYDDQPGIFIHVYEGENSQTCDNLLIATIELPGIPPAPRGVPRILVRFCFDAEGTLTVSAKDETTGKKVEVEVNNMGEVDITSSGVHHDDEHGQGLPIQMYHSSLVSENPSDSSSSLRPHELSNTNESSPHEFCEPSPADRSRITIESRPQVFSEPPEAYESINTAESRSQGISDPSLAYEPSNTMERRSHDHSEPRQAFESSNNVESRSLEVLEPAYEPSNTVESRSQDFYEPPQAFKSVKCVESSVVLEPPVAHGSRDTVEERSQEFPEPPQARESNCTVESRFQEFSGPPTSESSKSVESSSRVSSVQEILDTVHVLTPISDFRTHKKECSTFIRRVNMIVPLFEEFRDLELPLSEEVLTCFSFVKAALNAAKDLLLLCSKGSKLWLILEQRKVAEQFLLLSTALLQALDRLPKSLGISDEVREQVDLVHNQLKRSRGLEDAVDAQLNTELISILDETNERSPDQLTKLAELFKFDTASALRKESHALDGMTLEKEPSIPFPVGVRGFDQISGLLNDLRNLFSSEDLEQHEYFKPPGANGSSNAVESTLQESSTSPPRSPYSTSNSVEDRSLGYSEPLQVDRDEKTKLHESSAPAPALPSNSSNSSEDAFREFFAQPLRSPYSTSNSVEDRSFGYSEPLQVDRDEKTKLHESSAPAPAPALPSNSSKSSEDVFHEFFAQPLRSPYSTSNSVESKSLEYSELSRQVNSEKINSKESSAPPTYKSSHSFEGRPPHEHSEAPQVYRPSKTFGGRPSEFSEPTHSSSSTPESRSQEFSECSSKPEFPEHSPVQKIWNGLEGGPSEGSEPPSTRRMSSSSGSRRHEPSELSPVYKSSNDSESRRHESLELSPSNRSSSSSVVSSEDFSVSGPFRAHGGMQNPVSNSPELRRTATSADEPLHHSPRAENARSASCLISRTSNSIIEDVVKRYTWDQVLDITNDLTKTIGKGGFGAVYLGKLENEKEVAVKILDPSSQQGITEFLNEVNLLKRVNHVNLVRLLGYCLDEKQVLIYEFAEEGSIWDHLQVGGKILDWKTRLNIALQSACGLEYLHIGCHPRIIHRDIKSQNILLTKSFVAKVADFGLSKLGADQDNISKTHVTTMVKGTLGYLDPEYLKTGQLTEKSDVYSFGVVLLEIITGRKPIQNTDRKCFIGDWVEEHYNSNSSNSRGLKSVADPTLGGHFNSKALKLVLNVAKDCIQPYGLDRPDMPEVVHVLRKALMVEHDEKKSSKFFSFLS